MDIQMYETFLELSKTLNFRQASKNLDVAQSTVSNRIQALEEVYNSELFDRSNKKVSLTPVGQMVQPYAARIVKLHKEALRVTGHATTPMKGLRLGIDLGLQTPFILDLTRDFASLNPDMALSISRDSSKSILSGVLDGILDLGFVYNKADGLPLEFIPFEKDAFVFAVDKNTELAQNTIHKNHILEFDLVGFDYGARFEHWLGKYIPPHYSYNIEITGGGNPVDHIAGQGRAGFVLQSDIERSKYRDKVKLVNIEGTQMPYFQSYIVYNPSGISISNIMKFLDLLSRQKK